MADDQIEVLDLTTVSQFQPGDAVILTHLNGISEKIEVQNLTSRDPFIITATPTVTGPALGDGFAVRLLFTAAVTGLDTVTPLEINYNEEDYPVKVAKNGALVDYVATPVIENNITVYKYFPDYTTLELIFDNTNEYFIVAHDSSDSDGFNIGDFKPIGNSKIPFRWALCNGNAVSRDVYHKVYTEIGTAFGAGDGSTTFNLPDLRESTLKGAGLTGKSNNHLDADGLAIGEFIDDRVQTHNHYMDYNDAGGGNYRGSAHLLDGAVYNAYITQGMNGRQGVTTEVKAVGVNFIIKIS